MTTPTIGIDARLISYREGGIAEYTRRLIESLTLLEPDQPFIVFEGRKAVTAPRCEGNIAYVRTLTPCHHRLERFTFGIEVLSHRLRLLHSPDFIPPRFGARRNVITIHDLNFLYYPQFQTADSRRYYTDQIRAAVRKADHILVDSTATKTDVCQLLNVLPEKITVHMLGVHPQFQPLPPADVEAFLSRRGLTRGYILHVGTFEPRKNLPGLFDAYVTLRARTADLPPLVIAGRRGWLYESIFDKAAELKLTPHIHWLEDVPFADLPALYNGAGVLVMPSFYEGFGFPPLEAMACGVPVVVSDRSSLPEVVGPVGLLINPDDSNSIADALYSALSDTTWRKRAISEGVRRARTFTWEQTARTVTGVYRQLLD